MATAQHAGVEQIGEVAGAVWNCLNENGPRSLSQLVKDIDAPRDVIMQAVGWLAREDKLSIEEEGRSKVVALR